VKLSVQFFPFGVVDLVRLQPGGRLWAHVDRHAAVPAFIFIVFLSNDARPDRPIVLLDEGKGRRIIDDKNHGFGYDSQTRRANDVLAYRAI